MIVVDELGHGDVREDVRHNVLQDADIPEDELRQILVDDGLEYDELVEQIFVHQHLFTVTTELFYQIVLVEAEIVERIEVRDLRVIAVAIRHLLRLLDDSRVRL